MLTNAERMLTYADVAHSVPSEGSSTTANRTRKIGVVCVEEKADATSPGMLTYADACWRMLAYADVCLHMLRSVWHQCCGPGCVGLSALRAALLLDSVGAECESKGASICIAYVGIRRHTSAYVSIRQHTSAYVSIRKHPKVPAFVLSLLAVLVQYLQQQEGPRHTSAYASIRICTELTPAFAFVLSLLAVLVQ